MIVIFFCVVVYTYCYWKSNCQKLDVLRNLQSNSQNKEVIDAFPMYIIAGKICLHWNGWFVNLISFRMKMNTKNLEYYFIFYSLIGKWWNDVYKLKSIECFVWCMFCSVPIKYQSIYSTEVILEVFVFFFDFSIVFEFVRKKSDIIVYSVFTFTMAWIENKL